MITVSEEVLLLMLDHDTGGLNAEFSLPSLRHALGGALLMDLSLANRVDADLEKLFVVNSEPLGMAVLDEALTKIAAEDRQQSTGHWARVFADDYEHIQPQLLEHLVDRGILLRASLDRMAAPDAQDRHTKEDRPLWDVRQRIIYELLSSTILDARDVAIISLIDACALWSGLLDPDSLDELRPKIKKFAKIELIGQAVADAMEEQSRRQDAV
ncbi:MAG: GPP34 family phosphoprotein [Gammaproteobacteria bacterium]|nr:GPP34 family phosphoprotein [Gammaproteobacteria bacterium]